MAGLKITLPLYFTDPENLLPELVPDPIINAGSLMLIDLGREETAPLNSAPAHTAPLVNLAWEKAAALVGAGNEATLSAVWEDSLVGLPAMGLIERTGKKGLHVISSQTTIDLANRHGGIRIPDLVRNYVRAHLPGKSFYVSVWGRLTRLSTGGNQSIGYLGFSSNATQCAWNFNTQPSFTPASGGALIGSYSDPNALALGNFLRAGAVSDWTNTKPSEGSTIGRFWFGQQGAYTGFQQNNAASGVFYRFYIEDLTASGRSYAAALAADQALFAEAFGPGGRFASDTFTAPATIP